MATTGHTKIGFSHHGMRNRVTIKTTLEKYKKFLYNSENNEICQRSPESIGKLVLFYFVFYSCLALFFTLIMTFTMYVLIDSNKPEHTGMQNLQKENPGMGFRPLPDLHTPLIRFEQGVRSTYKRYTDHIQAFVDQFDNELHIGENLGGCTQGSGGADGQVCIFNIDDLGSECTWQKDYGFDMGQPCILLKLNMQYGWEPEAYPPEERPAEIRDHMHGLDEGKNYIHVTCEGENPSDRENIGNLTMYPAWGFPFWYYPYLNQEGYRQPVVMVRFENPRNGVIMNVWCKAWAYNLRHHRHDQAASTHFEILID